MTEISCNASLQVALSMLATNPQCFSETWAPHVLATSPASSINFPAKYPSGLLNVLPPPVVPRGLF